MSKLLHSIATVSLLAALCSAKSPTSFPDPAVDSDRAAKGRQTAVFAGGCFWCTEAVFEQLAGVDKVVSGFSGGDAASAHYEIVRDRKKSEPAEVITLSLTFDHRVVNGAVAASFVHDVKEQIEGFRVPRAKA